MSVRVKSTIVITGNALQYVQNKELEADDYAVVVPRLLHTCHGCVRGVALDCRGRRSNFVMPLTEFHSLELSEAPAANDNGGTGIESAL